MSSHDLRNKITHYLEKHRPDGSDPNYVHENQVEPFLSHLPFDTGIFPQCTKFVEDALENAVGIKLYNSVLDDMDKRRPSDVPNLPLHGVQGSNGYRYSEVLMHPKDPYNTDNLAAYMRHTGQLTERPPADPRTLQTGDILFFRKEGEPKLHHVAMVRGKDAEGMPTIAESTGSTISYPSWDKFMQNCHRDRFHLSAVGRLKELSHDHDIQHSHRVSYENSSTRQVDLAYQQTSQLKPTMPYPFTSELAECIAICKEVNALYAREFGRSMPLTIGVQRNGQTENVAHLHKITGKIVGMDDENIYHQSFAGKVTALDRLDVLSNARDPQGMNNAFNLAYTSGQPITLSIANGQPSLEHASQHELAQELDRGRGLSR